MKWSEMQQIRPAAQAFRVAHAAYAGVQLAALSYLWACAVTRKRDVALAASVGFLLVEGAALIVGRGNCPMGPFQQRLGDPVPLFELVLPPRAAKAAVPVLTGFAVAGMAALLIRRPTRFATPDRRRLPPCGKAVLDGQQAVKGS